MAKNKTPRKQLLKEPDEFLTFSRRSFLFVMQNTNYVLGFIGVIIVIGLVLTGSKYMTNKWENQAFFLLEKANSKYEKAISKDGWSESLYSEVDEMMKSLLDKYPRTTAGRFALYSYANVCYDASKYDQAIELYTKSASYLDTTSLKPFIKLGIAYSYAGKKDYNKAIPLFEELLTIQDGIQKDSILFQLAQMYQLTGNKNKSLESYQKIVSNYESSIYNKIASDALQM